MERDAAEHGRRDSDRARVENVGVDDDDEAIATDDVEPQPAEGMTVDDV